MTFDERLSWFVLGGLLGAVLGYAIGLIQGINRKVDVIEEEVHELLDIEDPDHDESGRMALPSINSVALFLVIALTVIASFMAQRAANKGEENQNDLEQITSCNSTVLYQALEALNERTLYSRAALDANVDLQKDQAAFVRVIVGPPPPSPEDGRHAIEEYYQSLRHFVLLSDRAAKQAEENPYPTVEQLAICLNKEN